MQQAAARPLRQGCERRAPTARAAVRLNDTRARCPAGGGRPAVVEGLRQTAAPDSFAEERQEQDAHRQVRPVRPQRRVSAGPPVCAARSPSPHARLAGSCCRWVFQPKVGKVGAYVCVENNRGPCELGQGGVWHMTPVPSNTTVRLRLPSMSARSAPRDADRARHRTRTWRLALARPPRRSRVRSALRSRVLMMRLTRVVARLRGVDVRLPGEDSLPPAHVQGGEGRHRPGRRPAPLRRATRAAPRHRPGTPRRCRRPACPAARSLLTAVCCRRCPRRSVCRFVACTSTRRSARTT
jgi:hypothetical protein